MKIAFCLHGISSGKNFKNGGLPVSFSNEALLFQQHIIKKNDVDCFYHTWKTDASDELLTLYKPTEYKVEEHKNFVQISWIDYLKHFINKFRKIDELQRVNNIYSRWYSFSQATKLALDYQKKMNIQYDYIFITRFDMSLFKEISFEVLEPSKFYCGDWYTFYDAQNQLIHEQDLFNNSSKVKKIVEGYPLNNHGISDFWFCASPKIMQSFSKIFFELEYLINIAGKSNHMIALEKLQSMNQLDKFVKILEFGKDYYLSRWIK